MAPRGRRPTVAASAFALLLLLACAFAPKPVKGKTTLDPAGIYGSVPDAQLCLDRVWDALQLQLNRDNEVSNCLRMSFHDAGTYSTATDEGGANGSIMNELLAPQSAGLGICPRIIDNVVQGVRAEGCAVTYADTIQVAGAVAVYLSGGPQCPMLMGRPDVDPGVQDAASLLPGHCDNAATQVDTFADMGFTDAVAAVAVLSGAHNIGNSRATGRDGCSRGLGPLTRNNDRFDGHYYNEVVDGTGRRGWFDSDRALNANDAATAGLMRTFAADHQAFLDAWCDQYQEMSLLGVDTAPAGFLVHDGWLAAADPAPEQGLPGGGGPGGGGRPGGGGPGGGGRPGGGLPGDGGPGGGGFGGGPDGFGPGGSGPGGGGPGGFGGGGPGGGGPGGGGPGGGGPGGGGPGGGGPGGGGPGGGRGGGGL